MATGWQKTFEIVALSQDRGRVEPWAGLSVLPFSLAALMSIAWMSSHGHGLKAAEPPVIAAQDPIADDNDPRVKAAVARAAAFIRNKGTTVSGGKLYRVSNLASPRPTARVGVADKRELFFQWRDAARRAVDLGLLRKAGEVPLTENAIVLHFYPRETELKLLQLESDYAARHGRPDLRQVAKTKFVVKTSETGYDFEVAKQTYLVQQM